MARQPTTFVINFRAPRELIEAIDARAAQERRTRANMIECLLAEALLSCARKPLPRRKVA